MTAVLLLSCACSLTPGEAYPVVRVVDGNTFDILVDGQSTRVRIPHTTTATATSASERGRQARDALSRAIGRRLLTLVLERQANDPRDNAILAYPFVAGRNVAIDVVASGWCRFTGGGRYATDLSLAEIEARQARRGLWRP